MTAEAVDTDILHVAREQVLERGERLTYDQIVQVLQINGVGSFMGTNFKYYRFK